MYPIWPGDLDYYFGLARASNEFKKKHIMFFLSLFHYEQIEALV